MCVAKIQVRAAAKPREYPVVRNGRRSGGPALDLSELWAYRELLYFFIWLDIEVRYKQPVVGVAWAVLQPLMPMIAFSWFFVQFDEPVFGKFYLTYDSRGKGTNRKLRLGRP